MRLTLSFLVAAAACAQGPPQPPIPTPPVAQLARLVKDYGNTFRYAAQKQTVSPPAAGEDQVVFMGDSILRFFADVVALQPRAVVIPAGTNDIGGSIGALPLEATEGLALNRWIKDSAAKMHFVYLDPNAAGYEIMGPLAERAIAQAPGK